MYKGIDCFISCPDVSEMKDTIEQLREYKQVDKIFLLVPSGADVLCEGCDVVRVDNIQSPELLKTIVGLTQADYVMISTSPKKIKFGYMSVKRLYNVAYSLGASLLYCDRFKTAGGENFASPTIDIQYGSVRDDFDFGAVTLNSVEMMRKYVEQRSDVELKYSGWYEYQLFLLRHKYEAPLFHLHEYLYTEEELDVRKSGEKQFDYVDPRNREAQIEKEQVFTEHLKLIGAFIDPETICPVDLLRHDFANEASVVIPVRNREKTIEDAVRSALSQQTKFKFNVIVVDNHSTDGTTEILRRLASEDKRLLHVIPLQNDLGIGGCWSLAVNNPECGRFAVQLDSDDLYSGSDTLQRIVDKFYEEGCAMVIGSYRMCNFQLETLPPGIIDHKEWTYENGRNNALRINGLGAPRAFFTPLLRKIGVPNTSYGEDYALGLAFSRKYHIGRIYDELYLCRRWDGNSDAVLSPEKVNANNAYKDGLRTIELLDRRNLNDYWNTSATPQMANDLFDSQLSAWKEVADRYAQLKNVLTSDFMVEECRVAAQFNPARIGSTGAKVDAKTISERPCFLCELNRPEEQQQCAIVKRYHLLVNPYPILPRHFTIAKIHHSPQAIYDNYVDMMRITEGLGDDMVVFYNGPLCGASAPDHMHFQAGSRGVVPLERDWDSKYRRIRSRLYPISESEYLEMNSYENMADNTGIFSLRGYVCPGIIVITRTPEANDILFKKIYDSLPVLEGSWEPMMNILAWKEASSIDGSPRIVSVILPRAKHRPECYFASGSEQILVSPGALDMGGLLITPRKEDFLKLTPKKVTSIIQECAMSLDDEQEMIMKLKNARI
ncbi:MAG: DUF4922 domain-containing protein [Bacteroidaceae bacterium]|nr:DUF4922 domain-containing protein [Bacteroidaceae bacterium]